MFFFAVIQYGNQMSNNEPVKKSIEKKLRKLKEKERKDKKKLAKPHTVKKRKSTSGIKGILRSFFCNRYAIDRNIHITKTNCVIKDHFTNSSHWPNWQFRSVCLHVLSFFCFVFFFRSQYVIVH